MRRSFFLRIIQSSVQTIFGLEFWLYTTESLFRSAVNRTLGATDVEANFDALYFNV